MDTPRTNLGDATYLGRPPPDFDMTQEPSFQSPSKDKNLLQQLRSGRAPSLRTPRGSRAPLGDMRNPPAGIGGSEFTPMLKSATRNSARRRGKENTNGLATPALAKIDEDMDMTNVPVESSLFGPSRNLSYVTATPLPEVEASSTASTPLVQPVRRPGNKGPLQDGNQLSLREQEGVIDKIEKENFGLKLKIHFLEEALRKTGPGFSEAALKENTELKVDKVTMQRELSKYKKQLTSAEKELEMYQQQILHVQEKAKKEYADQSQKAENDALRRRLKERDAEIDRLQRQIQQQSQEDVEKDELRGEIEDLEAELRTKDQDIGEREDEIGELKAKIEGLQQQLQEELGGGSEADELRTKMTQLEANLHVRDRDVDQREKQINELGRKMIDMESSSSRRLEEKIAEVDKLRDEIEDLEAELRAKDQDAGEREDEIGELKVKIEDLQHQLQRRTQDTATHSQLYGKIDRLEVDLRTRSDEANERGAEIRELKAQIEGLERQLQRQTQNKARESELHSEIKELEADLRRKTADISDRNAKIDDLKTQVEDFQRQLQRQSQEKAKEGELHGEIRELEADLRKKITEASKRDAEIDHLNTQVEDFQRQIQRQSQEKAKESELHGEIRELEANLRKKIAEASKRDTEIDHLRTQVEDFQRQIQRQHSEYASSEASLRTKENQANEQQAVIDELKAQVEGLQRHLQRKERDDNEAGKLHTEILRLESDLRAKNREVSEREDELRRDLNTKQSELISLRDEVSGLRDDLHRSEADRQGQSKKIEDLSDEVEVLQEALDQESEDAIQQLKEADKLSDDLKRQLREQEQQINRLSQLEGAADEIAVALRKELKQTKQDLLNAEEECEELRQKFDGASLQDSEMVKQANQATKDLRRQLLQAQKESTKAKLSCKDLRTQLDAARQNLVDAEEECKELKQKIGRASHHDAKKVTQADQATEDLRRQLLRAEGELTKTRLSCEALRTQLAAAGQDLDHANPLCQELRQKLDRERRKRTECEALAAKLQYDCDRLRKDAEESLAWIQARNAEHRVDLRDHEAVIQGAEWAKRRHEKEMRGMTLQTEWMQACWERESKRREDGVFIKKYLQRRLDIANACNKEDLRMLNRIHQTLGRKSTADLQTRRQQRDHPKPSQTPRPPSSKLKAFVCVVRAVARMRLDARRCGELEKTRLRLVAAWEAQNKKQKQKQVLC